MVIFLTSADAHCFLRLPNGVLSPMVPVMCFIFLLFKQRFVDYILFWTIKVIFFSRKSVCRRLFKTGCYWWVSISRCFFPKLWIQKTAFFSNAADINLISCTRDKSDYHVHGWCVIFSFVKLSFFPFLF